MILAERKRVGSDEYSDRFKAGSSDLYSVVSSEKYNHE
jgi:hypothetical protein